MPIVASNTTPEPADTVSAVIDLMRKSSIADVREGLKDLRKNYPGDFDAIYAFYQMIQRAKPPVDKLDQPIIIPGGMVS